MSVIPTFVLFLLLSNRARFPVDVTATALYFLFLPLILYAMPTITQFFLENFINLEILINIDEELPAKIKASVKSNRRTVLPP